MLLQGSRNDPQSFYGMYSMARNYSWHENKCTLSTSIEACLFKHPFYRGSHSKGIKERALHVHQRKTKHFIAKLLAQPYRLLHTFSILVFLPSFLMNFYWLKPFQQPIRKLCVMALTTSIEKVFRSM